MGLFFYDDSSVQSESSRVRCLHAPKTQQMELSSNGTLIYNTIRLYFTLHTDFCA